MVGRYLRQLSCAAVGVGVVVGGASAVSSALTSSDRVADGAGGSAVVAPITTPVHHHVRPHHYRPSGQPAAARAMTGAQLHSADGSLNTTVGVYSDCSGQTPLTTREAAIDSCVTGRLYFMGHNRGVFTPLMHMHAGDVIVYSNGAGATTRLRIVAVRDNWQRANGIAPTVAASVVAQFQTCESYSPDGAYDRILDAVAS